MQLSNFTGKTVAIMVASGFDEDMFIAIQRAMMSVNAKLRVISRDAGLTNAWNGSGWGMSYPVDSTLSTTLAVDYDALIIPTGERHVTTLEAEAHAKRLVRAFTREECGSCAWRAARFWKWSISPFHNRCRNRRRCRRSSCHATTENFMAGLEALNQAMVVDDGESVAA